jgi:predicted dehydrogenase
MKQVLQSYKTGQLSLADVPSPGVEPGAVLVLTTRSLVSTGTERMTMNLAKKSLLGKAKDRPDLVRKLIARAARDGVVAAVEAAQRKLDQPLPLGYSCAGRVIAVGDGVTDIPVGARVACAGAKIANHAEVNLVPRNLCVLVPEGVDDETAAFVTLGAIALQGVRQAAPTLGETFAVIGLGLIGQLAAQLLKAAGGRVVGVDLDPRKVEMAKSLGADTALGRNDNVHAAVQALTAGRGVDGVVITAATSSNDPVVLAGELCRDRGRVVAVGAVGMDVPRRPYYDKELTLLQSRSYGPGRYDPVYEEMGVDYPIGYVRWTEQRNMEAFLDQCASGRVRVTPLVSHRFAIAEAEAAYAIISSGGDPLGIMLSYPATATPARTVNVTGETTQTRASARGRLRVGFAGAGAFAAGTLLPGLQKLERARLQSIASARGYSARHLADKFGFAQATSEFSELLSADMDAVFIATRHNLHAQQASAALRAGKHVFVEKPLALDVDELQEVMAARRTSGRVLLVGYNRRFSPMARQIQAMFSARRGPLVMHYRVNAGPLPRDSWIYDPSVGGGRIVGEGCHFVDLLTYFAGAPPTEVFARAAAPRGESRPDENVILDLAFGDGSVGSLHYVASGDPVAGKERVEVLGDGACAYLEDFRLLDVHQDGKQRITRKLTQDKGHEAELRAFVDVCTLGGLPPIPDVDLEAVSLATFAAMESLATGRPVAIKSATS